MSDMPDLIGDADLEENGTRSQLEHGEGLPGKCRDGVDEDWPPVQRQEGPLAEQAGGNGAIAESDGGTTLLSNELLGHFVEDTKAPASVREAQEQASIKMMKAWTKLLDAKLPDGQPDIDTIMKASEQIANFSGWSASERNRTKAQLAEIVDRCFTFKEKMTEIARGGAAPAKSGGLNVSITQEALNELGK